MSMPFLLPKAADLDMSFEDFDYFRQCIHRIAGIWMADVKMDLLQSRLRSRVFELGLENYTDYAKLLKRTNEGSGEWQVFVNLLTTNKTDWFRENAHFEYLKNEFIPRWLGLKKQTLKVWCAASSTGEEPYTLAFVLQEALAPLQKDFEIKASDIDTDVLKRAQNGVYPRAMLSQIPGQYHSYLSMGDGDISNWMKVKSSLKTKINFCQVNLMQTPYPKNEVFDLIFCRNVLIYFNREHVAKVVEAFSHVAAHDSVLAIAHSESIQNMESGWNYLRPSLYTKGKIFR